MGLSRNLLRSAGFDRRTILSFFKSVLNYPKVLLSKTRMAKDRVVSLSNMRVPGLIREISADSLLFYYGNIHSQRGQDGILAEIFRRLGIQSGLFVEFGAWDGVYLSNSRWLFEKGWNGVFIEENSQRFDQLNNIYGDSTINIKSLVGAPSFGLIGEPLGKLLKSRGVDPVQVTFVSIDVDGPDLDIFEDMDFSPPVVLIEGGFNFVPTMETRQPPEIGWRFQQPLKVILDVASKRGYDAVCFCQDTYLVRKDLSSNFPKIDAHNLFRDAYFFMPDTFRKDILKTRLDFRIVEAEQNVFGVNRPHAPINLPSHDK